jgi:hypothetical protein
VKPLNIVKSPRQSTNGKELRYGEGIVCDDESGGATIKFVFWGNILICAADVGFFIFYAQLSMPTHAVRKIKE